MANSTVEQSKQIVQELLTAFQTGDFASLTHMFTPTATWWISGSPKYTKGAGYRPVRDAIPNFEAFFSTFEDPKLFINKMVAEDETVFAELSILGTSQGKPSYENDVVLVCDVDVQLMAIKAVREYINAATTEGYLNEIERAASTA